MWFTPDGKGMAAVEELEQFGAHEVAAPAAQGAHVGLTVAAAGGGNHLIEVRARGHELVGEAGLQCTGANERFREGDEWRVARLVPATGRSRARAARRRGCGRLRWGARARACPRYGRAARGSARGPCGRSAGAGRLDQRRIGEHRPDRPVLGLGGALAPGGKLARGRALAGPRGGSPGETPPRLVGIALVGRVLQRAALLRAHSRRPDSVSWSSMASASASRSSTSSRA